MKIWNCLLPETGSHEIRADNLGMADQMVYIDGVLLEAPRGTTLFTGPSGSLLELRQRGGNWELLVNGFVVEDYSAGKRRSKDDSVRDLRSRPDGSYTIATSFSSDCLQLNTVRKFHFTARGDLHEVEIAHQDWVWQIIHNGCLLDRRSHSVWENSGNCRFQVDVAGSAKLDVEVLMSWDTIKMLWLYTLLVNHMAVPPYWTKVRGELSVQIPEVVGDASSTSNAAVEPLLPEPSMVPEVPLELPQGVSYDSSSQCFQANIRQNNKFMFLGEFPTVEEAAARYLEESEKMRQRAVAN